MMENEKASQLTGFLFTLNLWCERISRHISHGISGIGIKGATNKTTKERNSFTQIDNPFFAKFSEKFKANFLINFDKCFS